MKLTNLERWKRLSELTWPGLASELGDVTDGAVRKWFDGSRPNLGSFPGGWDALLNRLEQLSSVPEAVSIVEEAKERLARGEPPVFLVDQEKGPGHSKGITEPLASSGFHTGQRHPWNPLPLREEIRVDGKLFYYTDRLALFDFPSPFRYGQTTLQEGKLFAKEDAVRLFGYLVASNACPGFSLCDSHRNKWIKRYGSNSIDGYSFLQPVDPLSQEFLRGVASWLEYWSDLCTWCLREEFTRLEEHLGWVVALAAFYEAKILAKVRRGMNGALPHWQSLRATRKKSLEDLSKHFEAATLNDEGFFLARDALAKGKFELDLPGGEEQVASDRLASLAVASLVGAYFDERLVAQL